MSGDKTPHDETTAPPGTPENEKPEPSAEDLQAAAEALETGPEQPEADTEDRVAALETELAEMKDRLIRQVAETENLRKRAAKEKQDASKYAVSNFAADVLSVADNLHRALSAVEGKDFSDNPAIEGLLGGIKGTARELQQVFERAGIRAIEPLGEAFDPNFHEAMYEVPTADYAPGTVADVMQPGYVIHDRVLRPARVGVAKALDTDGKAATTIDQTI